MSSIRQRRAFRVLLVIVVVLLLAACGGDDEGEEEKKSYTVAAIMQNPMFTEPWDAFKEEMTSRGYTEGENITYYVEPSADLLVQQVPPADIDLVLVLGGTFGGTETNSLSQAIRLAGGTIPIVVAPASGDPIESGDAESLGQPGGNITGIMLSDSDAKRFDLFAQMLPDDATTVVIVYNPDDVTGTRQLPDIETVAEEAGLDLVLLATPPSDPDSTPQAFADLPEDVDGVFMLKIWGTSMEWYEWAFHHNVPTSQDGYVDMAIPQPMMTYGPSLPTLGVDAARLADQIFKGTAAANLPIEFAGFSLMVDLAYAEAVGLEVPESIIDQAAEVRRTDLSVYPPPEDTAPAEDTVVSVEHPEGTGACAALQTSMGGTFSMCVTVSCDMLEDAGSITYDEKIEVGGCAEAGAIGTCAMADYDMVYYDGDPNALSIGCGFMTGEWSTAE